MLKSLFRKASFGELPRVPDDVRVYAIGDIHGCDDEFERLLAKIDVDHAARPAKRRIMVLLGDLVDRGPDSASVVERAMQLAQRDEEVRLIAGNHEELLLESCEGDGQALRVFVTNGGRETALSYGVTPNAYDEADFKELQALLAAAVPQRHRDFLGLMEEFVVIGDYAFVHAGIRPGVPLDKQVGADLRWIRDRFLRYAAPHEKMIVHGHTITPEVDERPNRIGIDTGAFASGRLTAIALEDERRWFLQS